MNKIGFSALKSSAGGAINRGTLSIGDSIIGSPTLLVTTSRCCVPHLTDDMLHRTLSAENYCGLLVHFESLVEDNAVMAKTSPFPVAKLIGYDGVPVWLATNETNYYAGKFFENEKKELPLTSTVNGPDWVSLLNSAGVTPFNLKATLPEICLNLKPNFVIAPTDHYNMQKARLKRMKKSSEQSSIYWNLVTDAFEKSDTITAVPTAVIHKCETEDESKKEYCDLEFERRINEIPADSYIVSLICSHPVNHSALQRIRKDNQAILLRGATAPENLKEMVNSGVDIFESVYATDLATKGIAFNIDIKTDLVNRLVMSDVEYFDSFTPLSESCQCVACAGADKTTRSYIHHLIMNEEMLGYVFLSSHNLWQYSNYLASLRSEN